MKVTVAIDSFKGSLTTFQSGSAIANGIKRVYEDAVVKICPMADGGEGTVDAIIGALNGEIVSVRVHDPFFRIIDSSYGLVKSTGTAVIEMSAASGITLIRPEERNPLKTTTFGVGELIRDAIDKGCRNFIIGIGGSATNDGGIGMLQALGFELLDNNGKSVPLGAKGLEKICTVKTDNALKELSECKFSIACDVKNPLCGDNGCSAIYGPQKGATPEMIKDMDEWLLKFAKLTEKETGVCCMNAEGAGAAGGLGFAFMSFLSGKLSSGVELVIKETGLEQHIKDSDIVITGEGRLDGQSNMGKAPIGVARLAKKYCKKVIAFSGCVTKDASLCNDNGIDAFFPILRTPCTLSDAMNTDNAYSNMQDAAEQVFRLIKTLENN